MTEIELSAKKLRSTGRWFLAVAILLGLGMLYNGYRTFALDRDTKEDIRDTSLEACERGNESRVTRVVSYLRDIETLRSDLKFVASFRPIFPDGMPALKWQEAKLRAITYKRDAIRGEINSVRQYAVRPGSPVVNCEAAYPPL